MPEQREVEYQDDPQQASNASSVLMERGRELLGTGGAADDIWNNLGFHIATVRLRENCPDIPIGPTAQVYIALVLAAKEHLEARKVLEAAARDG